MIFPIVWLLKHAAWIYFFETCFFCQRQFLPIQMPVIFTFFNTRDLQPRCAAHRQSNW